mmetsp:Transcript_45373/g.60233  ORF Transcript_45373/g.60233 Transcript_45373/m.60233 type:complete len:97 (+) Transcript_45373:436-726(+)
MHLKEADLEVVEIYGGHFTEHLQNIRQIVLGALASEVTMRNNVRDRIVNQVSQIIGRQISLIAYEEKRPLNAQLVFPSSALYLRVKGLDIIIFTLS